MPLVYSPLRKLLISFFIVFHWYCVAAYLMPNPSPIKTAMLSWKLPLPYHDRKKGEWGIKPREVASTYLFNTVQWQDWAMFAPDPLQVNRYGAVLIEYKNGEKAEYEMPRLSKMGYLDAWREKRSRKYQYSLIEPSSFAFRADLARYLARTMPHPPGSPPVRVKILDYESPIPRHDRKEVLDHPQAFVDYTTLIRKRGAYTSKVIFDYEVKPEDLKQ